MVSDSSFDIDDPNVMPGWTICSDKIKQQLLMAASSQKEIDKLIQTEQFERKSI